MPVAHTYTHTQSTPSDAWSITHNLNTMAPVVDCYIGGEKILPYNVQAVDANTLLIEWTVPFAGVARLV